MISSKAFDATSAVPDATFPTPLPTAEAMLPSNEPTTENAPIVTYDNMTIVTIILVAQVRNPCTKPTRLAATPETNPAPNNERINVTTVQIIKPVPTPSNGLFEVGSTMPKPIAEPINENVINNAINVTTPAKIEPQDKL